MSDDGGLDATIRALDAEEAARREEARAQETARQERASRLGAAGQAFAERARRAGIPLTQVRVQVSSQKATKKREVRAGGFLRAPKYENYEVELPVYEERAAWIVSTTERYVTGAGGSKESWHTEGFDAYVLPDGDVVSKIEPRVPLSLDRADEVLQKMANILRSHPS
jgi:hypothetical protein